MNQDIRDALEHLEQTIARSAPHVAPLQASTPTDAASLRTANDLLRTRLAEQERIVAHERARADGLERECAAALANLDLTAARLAAITAAALPIVEDEEGSPYVIVPRALVDALREAVRG